MEIEITNSDHYVCWIDSYQNGEIVINNTIYRHPISIQNHNIIAIHQPIHKLTASDLIPTSPIVPEIIILGTGIEQIFPSDRLMVELFQHGIRIDVMNTASAVRTFNLLIADNRNIWAWLWLK